MSHLTVRLPYTLHQQLVDLAQREKVEPEFGFNEDLIKVQFWVDEQRFLKLTVEDLLTNQTLLTNQSVAQLS